MRLCCHSNGCCDVINSFLHQAQTVYCSCRCTANKRDGCFDGSGRRGECSIHVLLVQDRRAKAAVLTSSASRKIIIFERPHKRVWVLGMANQLLEFAKCITRTVDCYTCSNLLSLLQQYFIGTTLDMVPNLIYYYEFWSFASIQFSS